MRSKWDEKRGSQTYGGMTLAKTLMAVGEYRSKNASNPYVREVARPEINSSPQLILETDRIQAGIVSSISDYLNAIERADLDPNQRQHLERKNPLRVVCLCAMWLTGFDVKCLSCLYIDKPLKAHTLMQTIALANHVDEVKSNGLNIC